MYWLYICTNLSSPEPKAQMSFSDWNLFVVRFCCRKLFTFASSSPEPLGQFQPNMAQNKLGYWEFNLFKRRALSSTYNNKHWNFFYKFFSRNTAPISTKLGTKHPLVREFKFAQMKDPALFQGEITAQ